MRTGDGSGALEENISPRQRVFLRTDKAVAYGDLMGIVNVLRTEEHLKVALVGWEAGSR
jgi:biopolymer transport protein ExbD